MKSRAGPVRTRPAVAPPGWTRAIVSPLASRSNRSRVSMGKAPSLWLRHNPGFNMVRGWLAESMGETVHQRHLRCFDFGGDHYHLGDSQTPRSPATRTGVQMKVTKVKRLLVRCGIVIGIGIAVLGSNTSLAYADPPAPPPVPDVPAPPPVPDIPAVPPIPDIPAVPPIPDIPAVPPIPDIPAVPPIPDIPAVPPIPDIPAVPPIPPIPGFSF